MPKRELNIFCFPNFQTPPGYDHYHSERTIGSEKGLAAESPEKSDDIESFTATSNHD
jgi:hypothetical protein